MSRAARLDRSLRFLLSGGSATPTPASADDDSFVRGVRALEAIWSGEFAVGADLAAGALASASDGDALALARAVAGFAVASWPEAVHDPRFIDPRRGSDTLSAALADPTSVSPELEPALVSLQAEAALACARLDLADALLAASAPPEALFGRDDHPYLTQMRILHARVAAFRADITTALALVDSAVAGATTPIERVFAHASAALVRGNADQRAETRALVDLLARVELLEPVDLVTRGCYVLAAYGVLALGDVPTAAELVLRGGGGPELGGLMIIDRALGLEMLVSAAAEDGDLDAAMAWLERAEPLAEHPVADSTVSRIRARVALLDGDPATAIETAERARDRAEADGRAIEAAEATILLARARILAESRGVAARELTERARSAHDTGHGAYLRSAARELRRVGRRLPPKAHSGWEGLSTREREVALLMADGLTNGELARRLYLSEHTVRIHVSRVLHAFGVPSRARVAALLPSGNASTHLPLTPRQRQIVDLLVAGLGNRQIAHALTISPSTVEKHIGAILRRWDVGSRAAIVRLAVNDAHPPGRSPGGVLLSIDARDP